MSTPALILVVLIALIHSCILVFEMFMWETRRGPKVFGHFPKDLFASTKTMAVNQGLSNDVLTARPI